MRITRVAAPLRRQVEQQLRGAIAEGQFPPGVRLIERDLCERMGVSRTSVREALRQLEAEGLVVTVPNRGPVVASVSVEEARQLYEVRAMLEGLAGRGFVRCGSAEQLAEIRRCVKDLEHVVQGKAGPGLIQIKTRFYEVLLAGCGNETARQMLTLLHNRITLLRSTSLSQPGRLSQTIKELKRIVAALDARDAEAAWSACVEHVNQAAAVALRVLSERQEVQQESKEAYVEQGTV